MIEWGRPDCDRIAPTAAIVGLLTQAASARPEDAALHFKLGLAHIERSDFEAARRRLEHVLRLDPAAGKARRGLARCLNRQRKHEAAVEVLLPVEPGELERGVALLALGAAEEAERDLRTLLGKNPDDRHATRHLGKLLRRSGRTDELLELCEDLWQRGGRNAQLLYSWGTALALTGREERARALLTDPSRVTALELPAPDSFDGLDEFNRALAEEILGNPDRRADFPPDEQANRGSERVHSFAAGTRPELVRSLVSLLQDLVDKHAPRRAGAFDPWLDARPARARINAWGLIQRDGNYEDWHLHRGGWLSGVYYLRVPAGIVVDGEGAGCIEFGAPRALAALRPDLDRRLRIAPREGLLLLSPSHYAHRTIPMGMPDYRISFAFDVVPEDSIGFRQ